MNDREDRSPDINKNSGVLTASPRNEHPEDAARPQKIEAPKPLTPKQKVEAITPPSEKISSNTSGPAAEGMLSLKLQDVGGYLPIAHSARQAPARQNLELRHGEFFLLALLELANPRPYPMMNHYGCLITDLIRNKYVDLSVAFLLTYTISIQSLLSLFQAR